MLRLGKTVILLCIFLALGTFPARAKGTAVKVVLTGPDWYGELVVEDPLLLEHLGLAVFEDVESSPELPADLGAGYLMDRYGDVSDDALPFDRVLYFPDPSGGRGYVYYLETVNGHGPYDGRWFHVSPEGEAEMEQVFAANGVHAGASPAAGKGEGDIARAALTLVPPLAGILIGWLLGRRDLSRKAG